MGNTATLIAADAPKSDTDLDRPATLEVGDELPAADAGEQPVVEGDCAMSEPQPDAAGHADGCAADETVDGAANGAAQPVDWDVSPSADGPTEGSVQSADVD